MRKREVKLVDCFVFVFCQWHEDLYRKSSGSIEQLHALISLLARLMITRSIYRYVGINLTEDVNNLLYSFFRAAKRNYNTWWLNNNSNLFSPRSGGQKFWRKVRVQLELCPSWGSRAAVSCLFWLPRAPGILCLRAASMSSRLYICLLPAFLRVSSLSLLSPWGL